MSKLKREFVNDKMKRDLLEHIEEGQLKSHQCILTDEQFSQKYGISLVSVRRAIKDLVNSGHLYRVQGKGTFVAGKIMDHVLPRFISASRMIHDKGMVPSTRILAKEVLKADKNMRIKLLVEKEDMIFRLERIRFGNGIPLIYETINIPEKLAPNIENLDLEHHPLHEQISNNYGVKVSGADQVIESIAVNKRISKLLEVVEGSPALVLEEVMFLEDGGAIEWSRAIYRCDKFKFHTRWGVLPLD